MLSTRFVVLPKGTVVLSRRFVVLPTGSVVLSKRFVVLPTRSVVLSTRSVVLPTGFVVLSTGAPSVDTTVVASRKTVLPVVVASRVVLVLVLSAGASGTIGNLVLAFAVGRHISASPLGTLLNTIDAIGVIILGPFNGKEKMFL